MTQSTVLQRIGGAMARCSLVLLTIVAGTVLAAGAHAQPLFRSETSIECSVLNSDLVFVGTVSELDEADAGDARGGRRATFAVEETLKGEHRPQRELPLRRSWELQRSFRPSMLRKWKRGSRRVLVFAREGADPAAAAIQLGDPELAVMTADFTLLRTPNEVLRAAQETVRRLPGVKRMATFRLIVPREAVAGMGWKQYYGTGGYVRLDVPVDARLENWAQRHLQSEKFLRRKEAARALRSFKSEENIRRVKELLDDEEWAFSKHAEQNMGIEVRDYGVRREAYESLQYWGVDVERPMVREEIVKLESVTTVNLSHTPVAAADLRSLARFEKLHSLYLWNSEVADEDLQVLAELENLQTLSLAGTDVSDAGVKHLAKMTNLRYLELAGTNVTDEGIQELVSLTGLEELDLTRARVTDSGIEALRKHLPNVKIQH